MRFSIIFCLCLVTTAFLQAQIQDISYGFKAGLNFSSLTGGVDEIGEMNTYTSGFHIGLLFDVGFTDNFGLRSELLYSQKGKEYQYEGDAYFVFDPFSLRINTTGTRTTNLTVSNSYVQLPVMGYAKFGRIEFMGGIYGGLRLGSLGNGTMNYQSERFDITQDFDLVYFYGRDQGGDFGGSLTPDFIQNNAVLIPSELGAYYEFSEGAPDKPLYKVGDFGLVGGISFYLGKNQTLFFNTRVEYGLTDVTNNNTDVSVVSLGSNNQFLFRNDDDRNITIHTALGFRF